MQERLSAIVGARISEFRRKMAEVRREAKTIPRKIVVEVTARHEKFQKTMNKMANYMQSFDTVARSFFGGLALAASPGLVPIIAATVGLLGALGPMLGVMGGSMFALATAFLFAGTAALAFGAASVPTITALFGETTKLTNAQKEARKAFEAVGSTWKGITKDLEPHVLSAFTKAMDITNRILNMSKPLFESAAIAVNNLLSSLNQSLNSAPVQAFFDYMNKSAGPMLEVVGKALGYFIQGFMSMMTAFGPLAEKTAQGFLNMSKGFAEWAAGLSNSEGFQSFVSYILENMPKIRGIFRDAIAGLVYMFSAFGPLSSDMMTSLQDMMARFKEWAKALGENEKFQNFIGYIRDNAPKVIKLIGNLVTFIVNLGIALAPVGSFILDLVNRFLEWSNRMMETHPIIGQIISVLVVLAGLFISAIPNIVLFAATFSGAGKALLGFFKIVWGYFIPFKGAIGMGLKMLGKSFGMFVFNIGKGTLQVIGFIVRLAVQFLLQAARMALAWVIAMGPVGWVIAIVGALVAFIIWKWDEVKAWTEKIWNALVEWFMNIVKKLHDYVRDNYEGIYNAIKQYIEMAKTIIETVWNFIKGTFENTVSFIKALVKGDFEKMASIINDQMELARETIQNIWDAVVEFFEGIDLYEIGQNIIQGLIDGIGSMGTAVWNAAKGIASSVVDSITGFLGIHSPSREAIWIMQQFGRGMVKGAQDSVASVKKAVTDLTKTAVLDAQRMELSINSSVNNEGFKSIRDEFSDNEFKQQKYETTQSLEGMFKGANFNVRNEQDIEEIARKIAKYVAGEGRKVYV